MEWYWWIGIGILALNGLLIALIAFALVAMRLRQKRAAQAERKGSEVKKEPETKTG